ncbi:MAG: glycogen debranching enzyme N-terminal domain-containing protein [Clostridia bacterium]|nr:glycogen debranching enzyme N-terminal domain-containing protein [Clostridia bacterium]
MFKYKREINNYDQARQIEYSFSDNSKVCFCTTGSLFTRKPYHGMYIKNGKVLLENLVETFEVDGQTYKVVEIETNSRELNSKEYVTNMDLEKNFFEYSLSEDISYTKRFAFEEKKGTLCIEYVIKNTARSNINFKVVPLITYRDFYNMKNNSMLKFNQRDTEDGTFIALSVLNQENIVLKSDKMRWEPDNKMLYEVKHELINEESKKEIYFEDLAICGQFVTEVKGFSETKLYVYISYKDFNIENINELEVFNNLEFRNRNAVFNVDESFIELKDLSKSILNTDMEDVLVPYLPYKKEYNDEYVKSISDLSASELEKDLDELIDITRAVEGQYLLYKKIKEAKNVVMTVHKVIKEVSKLELTEELKEKNNLLKLWYIEAVNRILQKEGRIELYIDSMKEIIYNLIEPENRATCFNTIEMAALMLNAVKVYLNILTWIGETDKQIELQEIYFKNLIENEFWVKEKNVMKKNLKEEDVYANVEMLYTLSLSFPCVTDDIPNKILDSVFKELYTPYGLRKVSKHYKKYDGMIYPQYMAHFIKSNLRLTGITRASQKISYNLVKELLQDVGKHVNGGVKKIYNEKGIAIDSMSYDVLTNAEIVRLYYMFI